MYNRTSHTYLVIAVMVALTLSACQSQTPRNTAKPAITPRPQQEVVPGVARSTPETTRSQSNTRESAQRVLLRLADIPAGQTPDALARVGFQRLTNDDLLQSIRGRVLRVVTSDSQFNSDGSVTLRDATLGQALTSKGTWAVRDGAVCQSSREEHTFCTAIFARGNETVCWPDSSGDADRVAVLRDCQVLSNGRLASIVMRNPPPRQQAAAAPTRTAPPVRTAPPARTARATPPAQAPRPTPKPTVTAIDDVVARLAALPTAEARRQLTGFGFRPAAAASLRGSLTGNTLSESRSLTYFARGGEASIRDDFLGRVLRSQGRWSVRGGAVCHTVREGHEFCTGVFVRGGETLCWPGMEASDTATVRSCSILRGNRAG